MNNKEGIGLFLRYIVLAALGLSKLKLFYYIFTPLTVYPVFWIISIVYPGSALLEGNLMFFGGFYAQIIPACVAGAAYYLLLIFNLTTPMKLGKRAWNLIFLFAAFLVLNILRIIIFSVLLASGYQYFDITHELTWYIGSTVMVVVLWFLSVWMFKIKETPIYSDLKTIVHDLRGGKNAGKT